MKPRTTALPPKGWPTPSEIGAYPVFAGLDETSLDDLAAAMTVRTWPSGALIFQRGDDGDYLLLVRSGRLRLSLSSPQGREIMLRTLGAGDVVGEMALIDGLPRSADATAVDPTEALILTRER
ncbi:MAG: cyclic nucleotide-binding domain-containing protein, partial [Rhodobacteraceae bacterium]|nr:cyclic nucleotide-binding domain-containing protein [Paracoccaceae bacterium]